MTLNFVPPQSYKKREKVSYYSPKHIKSSFISFSLLAIANLDKLSLVNFFFWVIYICCKSGCPFSF